MQYEYREHVTEDHPDQNQSNATYNQEAPGAARGEESCGVGRQGDMASFVKGIHLNGRETECPRNRAQAEARAFTGRIAGMTWRAKSSCVLMLFQFSIPPKLETIANSAIPPFS